MFLLILLCILIVTKHASCFFRHELWDGSDENLVINYYKLHTTGGVLTYENDLSVNGEMWANLFPLQHFSDVFYSLSLAIHIRCIYYFIYEIYSC